ncbi:RagB/SusD family nutrient uptake outer membrane protein [Chitinophaga sp. sic0106]|uniref:RagB/SusD family nutrient uptake outer membrane protein n=1 Tax=Chitinophaga sp. sic0106 TaxID=2854785 RepID=UPI001C46FC0B|nr:RagB/SusD family nutrient uptake outer membrane protein [Chitinophaga sp. sic0106]MBV7529140.1 RagB/SusD family nutrient uptake outer membrane protein [Chitinophaga sp. sic0106]
MIQQLFKYTAAGCMALALFAACKKSDSFLDKRQTESLTEQMVFSDSAKTLSFLTDMYVYTGSDIIHDRYTLVTSVVGNDYACFEDMTSHSVSYYGDPQAAFITGASTPKNFFSNNYYKTYYLKIRAANQYIAKVKKSPLSPAAQVRTAAEARFLRAFFYSQLVRLYGGVMIVSDTAYDLNTPMTYKRNSFKECIDYIAAECDKAAADLPGSLEQPAADYGRITRGMCQALKARMLVYAASPLFNGSAITTDPQLQPLVSYSGSYDATLWQKAADACKAIMNSSEYALFETETNASARPGYSFWKMFLLRKNSEYIMPYMFAPNTKIEGARFPLSRGGSGWSTPSQNLVDAFGMANGKATSAPGSGYDPKFPYNNRDPRFYCTVIYNQANVYNNSTKKMDPVDIYKTWQGQLTSDGLQAYSSRTGFYSRKMANDSTGRYTNQNRVLPVIRYTEILMGYAEAINELNGPTQEVYDIITAVRRRAGITPGADNLYGLEAGMSKEVMRGIIRSEYEVEFSYEGHWYYDTRRWKTAEVTENRPIQGMMVTKQQDNTWAYQAVTVLNAVFLYPKMYFCPFPFDEVNKSNDLIQNPGW